MFFFFFLSIKKKNLFELCLIAAGLQENIHLFSNEQFLFELSWLKSSKSCIARHKAVVSIIIRKWSKLSNHTYKHVGSYKKKTTGSPNLNTLLCADVLCVIKYNLFETHPKKKERCRKHNLIFLLKMKPMHCVWIPPPLPHSRKLTVKHIFRFTLYI